MSERAPRTTVIRFDDFELDVAQSTLCCLGRRIPLQEQPLQLLLVLLEDPGSLVPRETLRERLWPHDEYGQFDDSLNTAVFKLRRALGDSASSPRYIETVPKRGYRFLEAVTSTQPRSPNETDTVPSSRRPHHSRRWVTTTTVAGISTLVAIVVLWVLGESSVPFNERDRVLIAEFENVAGDDTFDRSLRVALATGIRQSQYVNVVDDSTVADTLRRMGCEPETPLRGEIAAEIAAREGARLLLIGNIAHIGRTYQLSARLVDPTTMSDVAIETARSSGRDGVLDALDILVEKIRRRLGESRSMVRASRVPLPRATTPSLEALKYFADAVDPRRAGQRHGTMIENLRRAVEIDPGFALAHMALGGVHYASHDRQKGESHFQQALVAVDRLGRRERLWLEAEVEGWRGNSDVAIATYRRFLRTYPDAGYGWFRLGYQYLALRRCSEAEEAFRRVLELDPDSAGAWVNIATCKALGGDFEEAVTCYRTGFEVRPEIRSPQVEREYAAALVQVGQHDEARQVFQSMIEDGGVYHRPLGHRGIAFLEVLEGHFPRAIAEFTTALEMHERLDDHVAAVRTLVFLAWIHRAIGDELALTADLDRIENTLARDQTTPYFAALAAKTLAREGRTGELADLVDRLADVTNNGNPQDLTGHHLLAGEQRLHAGDPSAAIDEFAVAVELQSEPFIQESLAEALARAGRVPEAIAVFESILDRPWFGYEAQFVWMWAPFRLAQLEESRDHLDRAATWYEHFANQWPDPDPPPVDVIESQRWLQHWNSRPIAPSVR